ncbi:hypothetical protein [Halocalculus aciditolerans]|uniref:Uncharacterized protein n=1 Tax=Halocalculus aciditolerans TaxID=1383812 RepID=A0A830F5N5_9EURY|nr:hypothetical protein [Halocalculus aciditolerans]GGL65575.1 hypothetical protein GCM10009039_24290 [Halocalculus aciditolerans]
MSARQLRLDDAVLVEAAHELLLTGQRLPRPLLSAAPPDGTTGEPLRDDVNAGPRDGDGRLRDHVHVVEPLREGVDSVPDDVVGVDGHDTDPDLVEAVLGGRRLVARPRDGRGDEPTERGRPEEERYASEREPE